MRGNWSSDAIFAYLKTRFSIRIINDLRISARLSGISLVWVRRCALGGNSGQGGLVGQHFKIVINARCYESVSIPI